MVTTTKSSRTFYMSDEDYELLTKLAEFDDRSRTKEIVFLVKKRLHEIGQGHLFED